MAVLRIALALLQSYLQYQKDQDVGKLQALIQLQMARFEELMEGLKTNLLQQLYRARVDEARDHIMTAQQDLQLVAERTDSETLDVVDDARDDALTAVNSLMLTLQALTSVSPDATTAEDQVYTDAVAAAFASAVDATALECAAFTKLDTLGWPDCSELVAKALSFQLELADFGLTTIRTLNDHHFKFVSHRYMDGNIPINQYGYAIDGKFVWVSEGIAGKNNSGPIKEAQDAMQQASTDRFTSLPEVQQIFTIVQEIEAGLRTAEATRQQTAARNKIAAFAEARRKIPAA